MIDLTSVPNAPGEAPVKPHTDKQITRIVEDWMYAEKLDWIEAAERLDISNFAIAQVLANQISPVVRKKLKLAFGEIV